MGDTERHTARVAVYIVFRREGKVLLIRRAHTGYRDGWYGLPSGHLEGQETATAAAIREGVEEVGVRVAPGQFEIVHVMHRNAPHIPGEYIDFYFRALSWEGEPKNCEPEKCDEIRWVAPNQLPENIIPEVRQALECIQKRTYYSEFAFS